MCGRTEWRGVVSRLLFEKRAVVVRGIVRVERVSMGHFEKERRERGEKSPNW
jgi:hypothetical protein